MPVSSAGLPSRTCGATARSPRPGATLRTVTDVPAWLLAAPSLTLTVMGSTSLAVPAVGSSR